MGAFNEEKVITTRTRDKFELLLFNFKYYILYKGSRSLILKIDIHFSYRLKQFGSKVTNRFRGCYITWFLLSNKLLYLINKYLNSKHTK